MAYVQRDPEGNICGVYANLQPGYAEELLDDSDPQVTGYLESIKIPPAAAQKKRK